MDEYESLSHSKYECIYHIVFIGKPLDYSEGVEELLGGLVDEMERRYVVLSEARVDNLAEYNAAGTSPMPRIVCVCDEYADLLLADKRRREQWRT